MALKRRNQRLYLWVRATLITVLVYAALRATGLNPGWSSALFALIAGGASLLAADLGVLAALIALALPLLAANAVAGSLFLVIGIAALRYLGSDGARPFLAIAAGVAGALLGPAWLGPLAAGFVLGAGEGAAVAAIGCLVVESLGLLLGRSAIGVTFIGGPTPASVTFASLPGTNIFDFGWVATAFGSVGSDTVSDLFGSFTGAQQPVALVLQPLVWAAAAAVVGMVAQEGRKRRSVALTYASLPLGAVVAAVGAAITFSVSAVPIRWWPDVTVAFVATVGVSLLVALAYERMFSPIEVGGEPVGSAAGSAPRSIASEDADVDELLRLIATAEEKLATDHTTNKVVMITDMKSFSRMTEEDGSMLTAKAIQRHRDLLLPIIEKHRGHGKSTGGDGLVAAFETAEDAVAAATEMQRTLENNNELHAAERALSIRVGVADGEVVLDKSGRPFIGAGLNLAARVMNLADGGQIYVTASVAVGAPQARAYSHGAFELKNIAQPVEVFEVLWADYQNPASPGGDVVE